ncbi:MAG TPA: hypothetical protein DIU39_02340 [Flavobacteriales bacterium]|nr:hypothetical protein [Flavobacteriales bacterium]|tara:strand:+ start:90766 stop:91344 length:579 start_codon:yes stop_codon:yes gene_type:complete
MEPITQLFVWWTLYFVLHSVLALKSVKDYFFNVFNMLPHHYRKMYVMLAVIMLIPPLRIISAQHNLILDVPVWVRIIGFVLILISLYLFPKAWRGYHLKSFIGLEPENQQKLVVSGMHHCVRHPLYSVSLLMLIGVMLAYPVDTVVFSSLYTIVYLYIGTLLEEKKLVDQFGEEYIAYKSKVPMLIPNFKHC